MYFFGSITWCLVWGFATSAVVRNRGYGEEDDKWFWLGFFFSIIAFVVALTKPVKQPPLTYSERERERKQNELDWQQEMLDNGGWKCICGRVNDQYVSSCACGRSRSNGEKKSIPDLSQRTEEKSDAEKIREFKALMDDGIITQEEFDEKKKQILGL